MSEQPESQNGEAPTNGAATPPPQGGMPELDEATRIALLEDHYEFPGFFPVVVIASRSVEFHARLESVVSEAQDGDPYRVNERQSSKGNYASYRVEMHVADARTALARKEMLGELPGIYALI